MKKKDFINREWHEGDVLYSIARKYYDCVDIPMKIIRVKVGAIYPNQNLYLCPCNKKDYSNWPCVYGSYSKWTRTNVHNELFETREEAEKAFEKMKNKFIEQDKERVRKILVRRLYELDSEKARIFSIMGMKIMRT